MVSPCREESPPGTAVNSNGKSYRGYPRVHIKHQIPGIPASLPYGYNMKQSFQILSIRIISLHSQYIMKRYLFFRSADNLHITNRISADIKIPDETCIFTSRTSVSPAYHHSLRQNQLTECLRIFMQRRLPHIMLQLNHLRCHFFHNSPCVVNNPFICSNTANSLGIQ